MTTSYTHDSPQLAATYDRISDSQFAGGKRLVERMNIREGERVLDVGCGTGRLGRWLAEVVGPSGSVVGVDPLPERIAIARTHAPGVEFEVGQAEDLSAFADAGFDAVCMSAVFHWVTDKPKALAEVRRVLRPGGRLGVTTVPRELNGAGTVAAVVASILQEVRPIRRLLEAGRREPRPHDDGRDRARPREPARSDRAPGDAAPLAPRERERRRRLPRGELVRELPPYRPRRPAACPA
jgi:ubiquinone/menaquinone biosynthesis C-methylase UbiE